MEKERKEIPKDHNISLEEIIKKNELEKEEKVVNLIIKIIVKATLKEYYETSNTVSEIQPTGAE